MIISYARRSKGPNRCAGSGAATDAKPGEVTKCPVCGIRIMRGRVARRGVPGHEDARKALVSA